MSAILDLINFTKVFVAGPPGSGGAEQVSEEDREKWVASNAQKKSDKITQNLETKLGEAEQAAEGRKAKYLKDKAGTDSFARFATETGLESATKQRTEGTAGQPQGPLQGSQAGVGTGKATGINRAKIAQKPLGTAGKIPSMSTKVKMNKPPKVTTPQQMSEMKMEKDNSDFHTWPAYQQWAERTKARGLDPMTTTMVDLHPDDVVTPEQHAETLNKIKVDMQNKFPDVYGESSVSKLLKAVDDEYNTKGERREAKRRKDRKMKVTGTGVRTLQQIMIDRANKLKGQEGTE